MVLNLMPPFSFSCEEVLKIGSERLEDLHPDTLWASSDLAMIYSYTKAKRLREKVLRKILGPRYVDILNSEAKYEDLKHE